MIKISNFTYPKSWRLITAAFFSFWLNSPYWIITIRLMSWGTASDIFFFLSQFLLVYGVTTSLLFLLPRTQTVRYILSILVMISSACMYYSYNYQVLIDRGMLLNVIKTDSHEVQGLLSIKLLLWVSIFSLPPLIWLWLGRFKKTTYSIKACTVNLSIALLAFSLSFAVGFSFYKHYASFFRNNSGLVKALVPYNFLSASYSLAKRHYSANKVHTAVGEDAHLIHSKTLEPTVWVLVIGETARADRFSLNGYDRQTNPHLSAQTGIISFRQAYSCGTFTAYSVPCLMSDLSAKDFDVDSAPYRDNLLDVVKRADIDVWWVDNQSGCQDTCERINYSRLNRDCPEKLCFDQQLVSALSEHLAKPLEKSQLIILHMNGSHGPAYYQRYPKNEERFTPSCNTNEIESCSSEELNNAYDNTIAYTDKILSAVIDELKALSMPSAMLYVSDHGESLGENGWYLHGSPYRLAPKEQKHIPFIFWANANFYQQKNLSTHCLKQQAEITTVQHDNVFHTVLSGLSIGTKLYQPQLDIFSSCQKGEE